jgi:hypothetical protein
VINIEEKIPVRNVLSNNALTPSDLTAVLLHVMFVLNDISYHSAITVMSPYPQFTAAQKKYLKIKEINDSRVSKRVPSKNGP